MAKEENGGGQRKRKREREREIGLITKMEFEGEHRIPR